MSESTPERYKPREEWTVDEILAHARTGAKPESTEYRQGRAEALSAAGYEPEGEESKELEEMTPADHDRRKYGDN